MNTIPIFINASSADSLPAQYARVSLPLPRGAVGNEPAIVIKNAAGKSMPAQSETLAHWPDGSPRVLHLTMRGRGGAYEAQISDKSTASPGNEPLKDAISIEESGGRITIETGRLRAILGGAGLIESICLGERELLGADGIEARATDGNGRAYLASAAHNVEMKIETAGPLRVVVALRGKFAFQKDSWLDFRLRFEFLAGVEGFSLGYTFFNLEPGQDFLPVGALDLQLRLKRNDATNAEYSVCQQTHGLFGLPRIVTTDESLHIAVDDTLSRAYVRNVAALNDETDYPFYMEPPCKTVDLWAQLQIGDAAMIVEMDDFNLMRPKMLHLEGDAARFEMWPQEAGTLSLQQGRSRQMTIRVALFDDGASASSARSNAAIAQLRDVWRGQLAPQSYAQTEFFDQSRVLPFAPLEHPRFEGWLGAMSTNLNSVATFWDLGDTPDAGYRSTYMPLGRSRRIRSDDGGQRWFSTGNHNPAMAMNDMEDFEPIWVNNEYDVIFGIGTEFLRTGDLSLFQKLRWFSRHTIDVDFLHYSDHKWLHRAQPAHSARHTTTGAYPSHFWTQGLAQYYFLSADPDALEVIVALADKTIENLEDPELGKLQSGLNREVGWGILSLVCAYEASGETRFDEYARRLLDECREIGVPHDIPVFSFGHTSLLLAVRQYLQVHKGEAEIEPISDWFLAFVDRGVECSRAAPPPAAGAEKEAGHYSYDEELAVRGQLFATTGRNGIFGNGTMVMDSLAFAYEISGDEKYLRAGLRSLEAYVSASGLGAGQIEGKPFAMTYRTWINYLKCVAQSGHLREWEFKQD